MNPCEVCGSADALGRHDAMCQRAIQLGLARLAEGEDPIDAEEIIEPNPFSDVPEEDPFVDNETEPEPEPRRQEPPMFRRRAPEPEILQLWFAYDADDLGKAVIFDSELTALRHAVEFGLKVRQLTLGQSLRLQIQDGPD